MNSATNLDHLELLSTCSAAGFAFSTSELHVWESNVKFSVGPVYVNGWLPTAALQVTAPRTVVYPELHRLRHMGQRYLGFAQNLAADIVNVQFFHVLFVHYGLLIPVVLCSFAA